MRELVYEYFIAPK